MDRFLLAENPMNARCKSLAVIHTIDPVAIIEVLEGHKRFDSGHYRHFIHNSVEPYTFRLHFQFSKSLADGDAQAKEVSQLFDRAWRWYRSYMEWEDNNIENDAK